MNYASFYSEYFPFWGQLSEEDKTYLCNHSTTVYFDKEQSVHNNNECSGLFIVKSGRLRLYMLSDEGKEISLYRLSAGDICMLSASCVLQSITFDVYVDAEEPSECYMIEGCAFNTLSEKIPAVKIYALGTAREVVSRLLKHFAADGILEVSRKGIVILDSKKLRSIAS